MVSSSLGKATPLQRRKALEHLDRQDRRTARKKIKLALRKQRQEGIHAGGVPQAVLKENSDNKLKKGKKKKKKDVHPIRNKNVISSLRLTRPSPPEVSHSAGVEEVDGFLSLGAPARSASSDPGTVKCYPPRRGALEADKTGSRKLFVELDNLRFKAAEAAFDQDQKSQGNKTTRRAVLKVPGATRIEQSRSPAEPAEPAEPALVISEARSGSAPVEGKQPRKTILDPVSELKEP